MTDINSVTITGRLTRDSEAIYSTSGVCILKFGLAVNRSKKDVSGEWRDEANFFDVVLFGKRAEALQNYLLKGLALAVTGELKQDRWESDGQKRSKVHIIANNVVFMGKGNTTGTSGGVTGEIRKGSLVQNLESNSRNTAELQTDSSDSDSFDDDIPF